ncbi:aspartate aminotransferase family protein [Priestia flexa]|uniref:aspartate aminotransferase family protein n=1 Tax=Priestia flexa TaxID=86664 RepID=UPI003D2EA135
MDHMEETLKLPSGELDNIAGIIVEPVQGAEGMIVPPPGFYRRLREMADKLGVLLIFDEIFTGMGRTGEFFAFEHEGIVPDIVILGKALGGGLPITLVATRRDISRSFPPLRQTSTFSAHPLASSTALATLEIIENENIISSAQKMGDYLIDKLRKLQNNFPLIGQVRGRGMMIGVELVLDKDKSPASKEAKKFVDMAKEEGLILLSGGNLGNVLKITPPLNLTIEQADFVIEKIEKILIKLKGEVVSDESCIVG